MTFDATLALCAAHPATAQSQPFGPGVEVFKVGEKIFAAVSDQGVCVKTADTDTARLIIEMGRGARAPYFHASWVLIGHEVAELAERIATSYALIRASLPKQVQAAL